MAWQASWALVAMGPTPWAPASVYPLWPSKRLEGENRKTAELAHGAFGLLGDYMTMIYKFFFIYWVSISYQGLCKLLYKQYHYSSSYGLWEISCFLIIQTRNLIKKAEHWRTDAFELWHWKWLLKVPWTTRRSNQSILKETNPEYSLEGWCWSWIAHHLATWCKELTHWQSPWCWEKLRAGGEGDDRGWDDCMASLTQWTWVWANWRDREGEGSLACCSLWGCKESGTTEQLYKDNI